MEQIKQIGGIDVTIKIDGEAGEWFGVTAYADESALIARGLLPADRELWMRGHQYDWYDTSYIGDNEGGLLVLATGGGAPEDHLRWVEGSGWRSGRQTSAYNALWSRDEWDVDSENYAERERFWEAVCDAVRGLYETADGMYEPSNDDDDDDDEN
jgi:hypothetical protein